MSIGDLLQKTSANVKPRTMPPSQAKVKDVKEETVQLTVKIPKNIIDQMNKIIAFRQMSQKKKISWAAFVRDCVVEAVKKETKT